MLKRVGVMVENGLVRWGVEVFGAGWCGVVWCDVLGLQMGSI